MSKVPACSPSSSMGICAIAKMESIRSTGSEIIISAPLALDEFVTHVNGLGPQVVRRLTKNDAAFEKQLVKKPKAEEADE